jgi:hypothetical protein
VTTLHQAQGQEARSLHKRKCAAKGYELKFFFFNKAFQDSSKGFTTCTVKNMSDVFHGHVVEFHLCGGPIEE